MIDLGSALLAWRLCMQNLKTASQSLEIIKILAARFCRFRTFDCHDIGNATKLIHGEFGDGPDQAHFLAVIKNRDLDRCRRRSNASLLYVLVVFGSSDWMRRSAEMVAVTPSSISWINSYQTGLDLFISTFGGLLVMSTANASRGGSALLETNNWQLETDVGRGRPRHN